jgi:hypothetical protein
MFAVDEPTAEAIRRAFHDSGELSAVVELRRYFPLIRDNEQARACVRTIAGWKPLPPTPVRAGRSAMADNVITAEMAATLDAEAIGTPFLSPSIKRRSKRSRRAPFSYIL